jgi:hypothetical protein
LRQRRKRYLAALQYNKKKERGAVVGAAIVCYPKTPYHAAMAKMPVFGLMLGAAEPALAALGTALGARAVAAGARPSSGAGHGFISNPTNT